MQCSEWSGSMRGGWVGIQHSHRLKGESAYTNQHPLSPFLASDPHPFLSRSPEPPPALLLLHFVAFLLLPRLMLPPGRPTQLNPTHPSRSAQGVPPAGDPLYHPPVHLVGISLACAAFPMTFEVPGIQQRTMLNPYPDGAYLLTGRDRK